MDMDAGMDLLQGVNDAAATPAPIDNAPFEMPSYEKIMELLEQMDMDDDEKSKIKDSLLNQGDLISKFAKMSTPAIDTADTTSAQFIIFFVAILFIALVFVFFGYKLYRSLTEKDRRREEKKKQKLQRKKK